MLKWGGCFSSVEFIRELSEALAQAFLFFAFTEAPSTEQGWAGPAFGPLQDWSILFRGLISLKLRNVGPEEVRVHSKFSFIIV